MRFLYIALTALFVFSGVCQAETVAGHKLSESEEIVQDMSSKLSRGVFNVLTGWGEIPRQMIKSGRDKGWWAVLPIGIPAGAIMTFVRTATGAFETLTFIVPIDDSYGPIIDPAFVWQKAKEK
ncbi:MAG: exosortase system-associated protein, TIGR04073 family [Kiritimatiellales bacterium]|nr:exosortase system-associated protein, TIGR04073 family [Kiritimatiellota bacterium]MBL7012230.1 exosortase system-associated protein, TIGR04073 family [Kiritimatiellales bacterium]